MRILLTVHQFLPDYRSGTEVLTLAVARELQRRGHDVRIFTAYPDARTLADQERLDRYETEGVAVYRFHHAHAPMGGQTVVTEQEYRNVLAARYFARTLRDFKPDIVHFFHLSRLGGLLVDVAVGAGVPAYYTPTDFWSVCQTAQLMLPGGKACAGPSLHLGNCVKHMAQMTQRGPVALAARLLPDSLADVVVAQTARGNLPPYPMAREVAAVHGRTNFLLRRLSWLDGIVSPTPMMTDVLKRYGVNPALIRQHAYGIDTDDLSAVPMPRDTNTPLHVGFIGTLAPHKGCHVLIDAVRRLPPGKVKLHVYGNPADFPAYAAALKQHAGASPDIVFCGTFPHHDIGRVLSTFHVLGIPSIWFENAPLVLHAAQATQRPVIASDLPGLTHVVTDGVNGLTFPAGNAQALAVAITRMADDDQFRARLAQNGQKPKSTAAYVDELLSLYAHGPLRDPAKHDYHGLEHIHPVEQA